MTWHMFGDEYYGLPLMQLRNVFLLYIRGNAMRHTLVQRTFTNGFTEVI